MSQSISECRPSDDNICKTGLGIHSEERMEKWSPQVGVHEHDAPPRPRERDGEIGDRRRLAVPRDRGGKHDRTDGASALKLDELDCPPKLAIRLSGSTRRL